LASIIKRLIRAPAFQVAGLALVLLSPVVLAGCLMFPADAADAMYSSDEALLELCAWHALEGTQLAGPYSHFGFRHPGPMYSYLVAPLYWLTGHDTASLPWTNILIVLATVTGILYVARDMGGQAGLLVCAALLSVYLKFLSVFVLILPWNPFFTIVPYLLTVLLLAAIAAGKLRYLPVAVLSASFVVQSHLAYVGVVAVPALLLIVWAIVREWRKSVPERSPERRRSKAILLVSLGLALLLWMPIAIEQASTTPGNLTRIVTFFATNGLHQFWSTTLAMLSEMLVVFPMSVLCASEPFEFRSQTVWSCEVLACLQILLVGVAFLVARRNGRTFEQSLCLLYAISVVASAVSIRRIVGPIHEHHVWWITSLSVVSLLAMAGAFLPWLAATLRIPSHGRRRQVAIAIPLLAIAITCTAQFADAFDAASQLRVRTSRGQDFMPIVTRVLDRLRQDEVEQLLVEIDDTDIYTWMVAAPIVLRLTKDGHPPGVAAQWVHMFGTQHAPPERPDAVLWLCNKSSGKRVRDEGRLEFVGEAGGVMIFWEPRS